MSLNDRRRRTFDHRSANLRIGDELGKLAQRPRTLTIDEAKARILARLEAEGHLAPSEDTTP